MTAPPPPGPGQHDAWNQSPAGCAWPPPAGIGGHPDPASGPGPGGYPGNAYGPGAGDYPAYAYGPGPGDYPGNAYGPGPGGDVYGPGPVGYPQAGGYPPPLQKPGTNGFAIAALIFGIIGGVLLGFIFGFIALSQTKRTGQNGRGLALAGIILSAMWTIGVILAIILLVTTSAIPTTALQPGDCVNNLQDSTEVQSLPGVPCTQPHEGEVFAVFELPAGDYPGDAAVGEQITNECVARLSSYSSSANQHSGNLRLVTIYPLEQDWNRGNRGVVCIAAAASGTSTGSIKDK
jgi:putative regulator of septum formation/uncharacterized protein DUF4190